MLPIGEEPGTYNKELTRECRNLIFSLSSVLNTRLKHIMYLVSISKLIW